MAVGVERAPGLSANCREAALTAASSFISRYAGLHPMPRMNGIVETAIHTIDMDRSRQFYEGVLTLEQIHTEERMTAYAVQRSVLLVFRSGAESQRIRLPAGTIPGHGSSGSLHLAFAIEDCEYEAWRHQLDLFRVATEGEYRWPRGGRSLYFRDPDGHLLEFATPGVWSVY